jgi:endonuclease YncB( thermonuclease family)
VYKVLIIIVLSFFVNIAWSAQSFEGTVTSVYDGDTFTLNNQVDVRLWGVDTAEREQTCQYNGQVKRCGLEAAHYLNDMILGHTIVCKKQGMSYGRPVAICTKDNSKVSINEHMAASGWGIEWAKYSNGAFSRATNYAKSNNRGMWRYEFTMPWVWRRNH